MADIDSRQGVKVVDEIKALGTQTISIKVDVTKSSEVHSMVQAVLSEFKRIDILVNNAGGSARERFTLFCESTERTFRLPVKPWHPRSIEKMLDPQILHMPVKLGANME